MLLRILPDLEPRMLPGRNRKSHPPSVGTPCSLLLFLPSTWSEGESLRGLISPTSLPQPPGSPREPGVQA